MNIFVRDEDIDHRAYETINSVLQTMPSPADGLMQVFRGTTRITCNDWDKDEQESAGTIHYHAYYPGKTNTHYILRYMSQENDETSACVNALHDAMAKYGVPDMSLLDCIFVVDSIRLKKGHANMDVMECIALFLAEILSESNPTLANFAVCGRAKTNPASQNTLERDAFQDAGWIMNDSDIYSGFTVKNIVSADTFPRVKPNRRRKRKTP